VRSKAATAAAGGDAAAPQPSAPPPPAGRSDGLAAESPYLAALLDWCAAVCARHGLPVRGFGACFADGAVFCTLVGGWGRLGPPLLPTAWFPLVAGWCQPASFRGWHAATRGTPAAMGPCVSCDGLGVTCVSPWISGDSPGTTCVGPFISCVGPSLHQF
jgi:hypothetical protein